MVTLRVAKVTIQADHKLRVAKVTAQGAAGAPKLRVSAVTVRGFLPMDIDPIPDQTAEALAVATITVPGASNFPPSTTFAWRQISGPSAAFSDNGSFITFTSPPAMAGTTVVYGVSAVQGGQSSTEVQATVNVLPHLYWVASGSAWAPLTRRVAV